jgi:hypothetical protein
MLTEKPRGILPARNVLAAPQCSQVASIEARLRRSASLGGSLNVLSAGSSASRTPEPLIVAPVPMHAFVTA